MENSIEKLDNESKPKRKRDHNFTQAENELIWKLMQLIDPMGLTGGQAYAKPVVREKKYKILEKIKADFELQSQRTITMVQLRKKLSSLRGLKKSSNSSTNSECVKVEINTEDFFDDEFLEMPIEDSDDIDEDAEDYHQNDSLSILQSNTNSKTSSQINPNTIQPNNYKSIEELKRIKLIMEINLMKVQLAKECHYLNENNITIPNLINEDN